MPVWGRVLSFLFILFATNILQIYLKDKKFLVITFWIPQVSSRLLLNNVILDIHLEISLDACFWKLEDTQEMIMLDSWLQKTFVWDIA